MSFWYIAHTKNVKEFPWHSWLDEHRKYTGVHIQMVGFWMSTERTACDEFNTCVYDWMFSGKWIIFWSVQLNAYSIQNHPENDWLERSTHYRGESCCVLDIVTDRKMGILQGLEAKSRICFDRRISENSSMWQAKQRALFRNAKPVSRAWDKTYGTITRSSPKDAPLKWRFVYHAVLLRKSCVWQYLFYRELVTNSG